MSGNVIAIVTLASSTLLTLILLIQKWNECNRLIQQIIDDGDRRRQGDSEDALWREIHRLEDLINEKTNTKSGSVRSKKRYTPDW